MNNKNDQPKNERECSGRQGDEHQPAHHTKGIKQLPIVFSIDHAGVHTDPSSTRQPWALAIKPHATTDPTGASATRRMRTRTIQYKIQGKRFQTGKGGGFIAAS